MEILWIGLGVIGIIALLVVIGQINIAKASKCKGCKKTLSYPEDFTIYAGPQMWAEKQKQDGTKYLVYYRRVLVDVNCKACGNSYSIKREIIVNRSDSGHSQNAAQELEILKSKIAREFKKEVFNGKKIEINFIEEDV